MRKSLTFAILSILVSASAWAQGFRFISWADTKTGTAILQALSTQAKPLGAKFTIYPGDVCSSGPTIACADVWKAALNGGSNNGTFDVTFASRGNHDSAGTSIWQGYFDFAAVASRVGASNFKAQTSDLTYSFDYQNSHFVALDCPGGDVSTLSSTLISWLDSDLTAAESRGLTHAFLFWHGPYYYVDGHSSSIPATLTAVLNKRPIVSATFHGHEHVLAYAHIDSKRVASTVYPFEEFVTGSAGADLYTCAAGRSEWCQSVQGFATVDVNGPQVAVNFYAKGNTTPIKTVSFTKGVVPPPPPPPPPANGCTTGSSAWFNQVFPAQTGQFTASFDATASAAGVDAVTALSSASASAYTGYAAIVRFYTNNRIEARNGSTYASLTPIPYSAGLSYHFRLVVDVPTHKYDAYVTPAGGSEITIGKGYGFRTEQATATSLSYLSMRDAVGSHTVCNFAVSSAPPPVPQLTIGTTTVPNGQQGSAYSVQLLASNGTTPYTWSIAAGSLPASLSLSAGGLISGTPTVNGTFTFTAKVVDSSTVQQSAAQALTLYIAPLPLTISTSSLPDGTQGQPYSQQLQASGGVSLYSWSLYSGSLPSGLALSSTGAITGTPTAAQVVSFTVQVTDGATQAATKALTLTVNAPVAAGGSRGYVTTPGELTQIAQKAAQGIEPYKSAVAAIKTFAGSATNWPYGTITGAQSCSGTLQPSFVGNGAPLIEAKAFIYGLTGDTAFAADIRAHLLDLTDTTAYGGETYSGGNQCILNLSWYIPSWIIAADLLEGYSGWSANDKKAFQTWLATEVYKKVDWASDARENNWGAAGSATAGMIADYLTGSGILMKDRTGASINSHDAYIQARQRQLDRVNGNSYMDNNNCHLPGVGFRPDGGIPEELARGSTGCNGTYIVSQDSSWTYTQTHLQGTFMHAELLLRRGDSSLYDNLTPTGAGNPKKAVWFVIHNPTGHSQPWKMSNDGPTMEFAYRYYRDAYMAQQLGIGGTRYIGSKSGQMLHFGTITHGFATSENPGPPPVVPAP